MTRVSRDECGAGRRANCGPQPVNGVFGGRNVGVGILLALLNAQENILLFIDRVGDLWSAVVFVDFVSE